MSNNELSDLFAEYVLKHNDDSLRSILVQPDDLQHYSLIVNFVILFEEKIELANAILSDSENALPQCDEGIVIAQKKVVSEIIDDEKYLYSIKSKVHARITGLPSSPELQRTVFPRNEDLGNFLKVSGTVVKVTLPKLLEFEREFQCLKCCTSQIVTANFYLSHVLQPPAACPNVCLPVNFSVVKTEGGGRYRDYQEIKVQEEVGKLCVGSIPGSIWVTLDDDLVDTCHPGDHVTIYGTALRRWHGLQSNARSEVELVVKANNLQVSNDQKSARLVTDEAKKKFADFWKFYRKKPLVGRDLILASFCPDVYGLYLVKLSMCIVLAGGVPRSEETGSSVRSESHLLLVGDPGTGKSHLLRFAAKTSSRSVLTTGVGTTSAGLTVCAVREGSDWQLEAGALVLADGGVCCIDELNSIREQDRTSIHEAMEQQTISVAKAGMVTKLNSRCSIIAATNAKGPYDPSQSISFNVALASPLLSRFDLVLILQDTRCEDWDNLLSSYILNMSSIKLTSSPDLWCLQTLQSYFALVKSYHPQMSLGANTVLSKYYQTQRAADSRNAARTTVRMLESLVRLSQGHARLMMRDEVTVLDAVVAVTLMECSMASSALVGSTNALHAAFPDDPHLQYRRQVELILKKLNLNSLLQEELANISKFEMCSSFSNESPTDISTINDKVDHPVEFSQRFNNILTDIRKKKDRDICNVARLTGKRSSHELPRMKKKKRLEKLLEGDSEDEDDLKDDHGPDISFPVGPNKTIIASDVCNQNCNDKIVSPSEKLPAQKKPDDTLMKAQTKKSSRDKPAAFKYVKRKGDETVAFSKNSSNTNDTQNLSSSDDSFCCDPIVASTPVPNHEPANLRVDHGIAEIPETSCRVPPENESAIDILSLIRKNSSEPPTVVSNPLNSFNTSSRETDGTVHVPSPLLTQYQSTQENFYDRHKLNALVKLGRSLSQSQSSRLNTQSVVQRSSQFSLKELDWDNVDLEI